MSKDQVISNPSMVRIPAEWEPHACCWMAWAVHREWGKAVNRVKRELSEVIQTIAQYEPVRLLAPPGPTFREARREFSSCSNVTVIDTPVDDIWMRDIAPTFAWRGNGHEQELVAIDWNFNGWGKPSNRPPRAGDRLASKATSIFGIPRISVGFVAEGGALVTDGQGSLIATRSCLLNPNRNPVRRGPTSAPWNVAGSQIRSLESRFLWSSVLSLGGTV
jgi:agmatine deiminase